jgi:streptogramin lyase
MSSAWMSLGVAAIAACGFPHLPRLAGGADGGDAEPAPVGLELLAGDIGGPGNEDGVGATARFGRPGGIAVGSDGNIYIADSSNNTIRRVSPDGTVTTLAGVAGMPGTTDGGGAAASFGQPSGLAVGGAGVIYVADQGGCTIRVVTYAGSVTTLAGMPAMPGSADGMAATARFNQPSGVAVGFDGSIYIADSGNYTIRKLTAEGVVMTLAGVAGMTGSADGTGAAARFGYPAAVAIDVDGDLVVADRDNHTIRKVTPAGVVTTLAGTAGMLGGTNGAGAAVRFNSPSGVTVDRAGNIYVADLGNNMIRKITPSRDVTTLAGDVAFGSADGRGLAARFSEPVGVATDSAGNVYVADTGNSMVRKVVTGTGDVTTLAGTVSEPGSQDGAGPAARFSNVTGVALGGDGNLYVADQNNSTLRRVTLAGAVTTLAGAVGMTGSADGAGASAEFFFPFGVAVGGDGTVYIADQFNHTVRKVTAAGVVTTLAGAARMQGLVNATGAGARFNRPVGVAVDSAGNVYVADQINHTIRKITAGGVVSTLAGNGVSGGGDGASAEASFSLPCGVAVDGAGNVYVADMGNHTLRKVTPAGVVTTLAGSADVLGSADGTGADARFNWPCGVAVGGDGSLYVADSRNFTVRKVTPAGVTTVAGVAGVAGVVLGATPRFGFLTGLAVVGDSLAITGGNAILLLRHGAR